MCNPERKLDFELFQLRSEVSALDVEIEEYLSSTQGRFEQWCADFERRRKWGDGIEGEPTP